jgi:rhodanese-related sulfurtransferase
MKVIDRDTLQRHLHKDTEFVLIEALPRESFEEFHLPTAVNVPLGADFDERVAETVPNQETPVVVYCASTQCKASEKAAARLEELGYCEVYDYEAGKEDWQEHGLPLEQSVAGA